MVAQALVAAADAANAPTRRTLLRRSEIEQACFAALAERRCAPRTWTWTWTVAVSGVRSTRKAATAEETRRRRGGWLVRAWRKRKNQQEVLESHRSVRLFPKWQRGGGWPCHRTGTKDTIRAKPYSTKAIERGEYGRTHVISATNGRPAYGYRVSHKKHIHTQKPSHTARGSYMCVYVCLFYFLVRRRRWWWRKK